MLRSKRKSIRLPSRKKLTTFLTDRSTLEDTANNARACCAIYGASAVVPNPTQCLETHSDIHVESSVSLLSDYLDITYQISGEQVILRK